MRETPYWRRYLRFLGSDPGADVEDELEFHLSMRVEDLMRVGLSEAEARAVAEREFGDVGRIRSEMREIGRQRQRRQERARGWDSLRQDVRFAGRTLRRSPGFAAVAILTLALGIGASTAMFSLVNSVLLRPLPYTNPDRLVMVWERPPGAPESDNTVSPANFVAWREQTRSFEGLTAWTESPTNLSGDGEPEEVLARLPTPNYFEVLGVRAQLGRTFVPGDEDADVVVLSHRLWQRRYGGDPEIVGRAITMGGLPRTVIGVMPPDFRPVGATDPELWRAFEPPAEGRPRFLRVVGRVRASVTLEQTRAEMRHIASRLAEEHPESNAGWSADVVPLHEQEIGTARPALLVLLGSVGLLLLIACGNVANLMLGRATSRRTEMAVRLSLGATRGRLVRLTLTEALAVASLAGAIGLLLAAGATNLLVGLIPSEVALPRLEEVALDWRVIGFAVGISLSTAVLFGIVPALSGSAMELNSTLRDATRGSTGGQNRLRRMLVIAQVALTVVLLVGAGLLVRSFRNLLETDPGMRTEHVLTMRLSLSSSKYRTDADALRGFVSDLLPRLQALPGVGAVGMTHSLPLSGSWGMSSGFWIAGTPEPSPEEMPTANIRTITGDYHRALGIPLLRGRTFDARDHETAPRVYLINEALAKAQFPGEDPIGKRLVIGWGEPLEGEIVGVVGGVRETSLDQEPRPAIYWAYRQMPQQPVYVVLHTAGDPAALAAAASDAVLEIDPNQPAAEIRSLEQVVRATVARRRLHLMLLGGFAGTSLLLAAIGLFGVLSYLVAQRRQEIGVRVALGARPPDVLRLVVGEGMRLTLLGLLLGLAAGLALTRLLASQLYGVTPTDPLTIAAVAIIFAGIALVASWIPARRAARTDPAIALRAQ